MTGGTNDAATLERWNVVNRVFAGEDFDAAARGFATDLAEGPPQAQGDQARPRAFPARRGAGSE
jgi:enoyl-CoA hydratase/carnithine racemase